VAVAAAVVVVAVVVAGNSAHLGASSITDTSGRPGSLRAFLLVNHILPTIPATREICRQALTCFVSDREVAVHLSVRDGCATLNAVKLNQHALGI